MWPGIVPPVYAKHALIRGWRKLAHAQLFGHALKPHVVPANVMISMVRSVREMSADGRRSGSLTGRPGWG